MFPLHVDANHFCAVAVDAVDWNLETESRKVHNEPRCEIQADDH